VTAVSGAGDKVGEHAGQLLALGFLQKVAGALDRDVRPILSPPREM
jgi:hypothetical protein